MDYFYKGSVLPTVTDIPRKMFNMKARQLRKTLHNLQITVVCGLITILVLRGTVGAGSFGTPAQDYHELRSHLRMKEAGRILLTHPIEGTQLQMGSSEEEFLTRYSLGPTISGWDEQRAAVRGTSKNGKPRMLMVTGSQPNACENPTGDHFLLRSLKNKADYCRLHGIDIFYNTAHIDGELTGFWAKLPLLRRLMTAHPDVEWFWWLDSDAVITDMAFELPMDKYGDHNMVLHGWDHEVYERRNWLGLNTGSFLIRNCQWSLDLLEAWAPMGPKGTVRMNAGKLLTRNLEGRPDFEADDQSALVYLLGKRKEMWGQKVFLESSYHLHGYWAVLVDKYEELIARSRPGFGDDRWPFVTHFVGCKPCGKHGDYPVEQCSKGMERALNFADDQVLERYGFRHKDLGTTDVQGHRSSSKQDKALN